MKGVVCDLVLFIIIVYTCRGEIILVSPGNGQENVYYPIDTNVTLHCEANQTRPLWLIGDDRDSFRIEEHRIILHSRGIFQYGEMTSSNGVSVSHLIVFGGVMNNNTRVCCQAFVGTRRVESCTTVIIYDHPPPPQNVSVETTGVANRFNITWTAHPVMGVDQNYTITFNSHYAKSRKPHYVIHNLGLTTMCGEFLAHVKAVNGAGESDPSNNVTIPSLPDIEPVTASLTHQVWKSNGHIMVNVSFEEALYCAEYPVLAYIVTLGPQPTGELIVVTVNGNETEHNILLGPNDGLRFDQRYMVTVSTVTTIGSTASNASKLLITSDLQAINVSLVDELTLHAQCTFISGSDATGCLIVIISNQRGVKSENATLSREQGALYASGQLNLTHESHCYDRVVAFYIDKHNITSGFSVETELPGTTNIKCSDIASPLVITVTVLITLITIITIITTIIALLVIKKLKAKNRGKKTSLSRINNQTQKQSQESKHGIQFSTSQHKEGSPPHLEHTKQKMEDKSDLRSSVVTDNNEKNAHEALVSEVTLSTNTTPIYAVPHKKKKDGSSDGQRPSDQDETCKSTTELCNNLEDKSKPVQEECIVSSAKKAPETCHEEKDSQQEHIYHVLEQSEVPDAVPLSPSHDAPQIPPPFDPDNFTPAPVYQDINELQTK